MYLEVGETLQEEFNFVQRDEFHQGLSIESPKLILQE